MLGVEHVNLQACILDQVESKSSHLRLKYEYKA